MGLLRDENGYVLVLRKPGFIPSDETAEAKSVIPQPARITPAEPAIRCSVPHCCFYCSWCGRELLLQHDRMGSPFGFPDARKIDIRSIAIPCPTCNHVGGYSMFRGCRGFDTRHKIVQAQMSADPVLLTWLHCAEKTCTARVPLFVNATPERPLEGMNAGDWLWDDLTCASGHRIRPASVDPTSRLP